MKPTRFLASCSLMLSTFSSRCRGDHQHQHVEGSTRGILRSSYAQTWPPALCNAIAAGCVATIRSRRRAYCMDQRLGDDVFLSTLSYPTSRRDDGDDTCKACKGNVKKTDPRHTRTGRCRHPNVTPVEPVRYSCPGCVRNLSQLDALWWCDAMSMLADGLTKGSCPRKALLEAFCRGRWVLNVTDAEKRPVSIRGKHSGN